jgi:hypothetical protein
MVYSRVAYVFSRFPLTIVLTIYNANGEPQLFQSTRRIITTPLHAKHCNESQLQIAFTFKQQTHNVDNLVQQLGQFSHTT